MDKNKAIGYALIIIGLIFGIEGTAITFIGSGFLGEVNEAIALFNVFESPFIGLLQSLQVVLSVLVGYSLLKTTAGIACILLGYKALTEKK